MATFHNLTVSSIIKETSECVSIAFDIPENLSKDFAYIQGQYITLKLKVGDEEIRRCYSICSSPVSDTDFRVAVKKVVNGKGSTWLNEQLKIGDSIGVLPPTGNFYPQLDAGNDKNYVLFAGGSGITPIISILKTIIVVEPQSHTTLFYANLDEDSVVFNKELDLLEGEYTERVKIYHVLDKPKNEFDKVFTGIMTAEKTTEIINETKILDADNEYFICGPPGMKEGVVTSLKSRNVPDNKINIEVFTIDESQEEQVTEDDGGDSVIEAEATIILDGDEFNFTVLPENSILQTGLNEGLDVPFSCKGGMCMTCRAKLLEGSVKMTLNYALTEVEIKQGYILTCQSHPTTKKVVVDYDQGL